jgi:hypothetical protein
MMPRLLYERLDEIGTDFAVIYPTAGLGLPRIKDDENRRTVIRAYNIGGVTRRFPQLNFGFLEGGVGWAVQLFGDLIEH